MIIRIFSRSYALELSDSGQVILDDHVQLKALVFALQATYIHVHANNRKIVLFLGNYNAKQARNEEPQS